MKSTNNLQNPSAELVERFKKASERGIILDPRDLVYLFDRHIEAPLLDASGRVISGGRSFDFFGYVQTLVDTHGAAVKEVKQLPLSLVRRHKTYQEILAKEHLLHDSLREVVALGTYLYELKQAGFKVAGRIDQIVPTAVLPNIIKNPKCLDVLLTHATQLSISCCGGLNPETKQRVHPEKYGIGDTWIGPADSSQEGLYQKLKKYIVENDKPGTGLLTHGICPDCITTFYSDFA